MLTSSILGAGKNRWRTKSFVGSCFSILDNDNEHQLVIETIFNGFYDNKYLKTPCLLLKVFFASNLLDFSAISTMTACWSICKYCPDSTLCFVHSIIGRGPAAVLITAFHFMPLATTAIPSSLPASHCYCQIQYHLHSFPNKIRKHHTDGLFVCPDPTLGLFSVSTHWKSSVFFGLSRMADVLFAANHIEKMQNIRFFFALLPIEPRYFIVLNRGCCCCLRIVKFALLKSSACRD